MMNRFQRVRAKVFLTLKGLWHRMTVGARVMVVDGDRVLHEEVIFRSPGRIYEPVVGPDGAIYLCTDDPGQIIRLTAAAQRRI